MTDDERTTKPTIETLLARMNEWGEQVTHEFAQLRAGQEELRRGQEGLRTSVEQLFKGQEELRKGQEEFRAEVKTGLHRVERKIEILNDNILTVNADIRDLEVRLEKLEAESLTKN